MSSGAEYLRALGGALLAGAFLLGLGLGCNGNGDGDGDGEGPSETADMQEGSTIVDTPGDFQDDTSILSPPLLGKPLSQCGSAVRVHGFVPGAELRIIRNGTDQIGSKVAWDSGGVMVPLTTELVTGWRITATQTSGGTTSNPSVERIVQSHLETYPDGLPRPDFPYLPLYDCGRGTVVGELPPGGEVDVFDNVSTPIGHASGVGTGVGLTVSPAFQETHEITAISSICETDSDRSAAREVEPAPPVTAPDPEEPHENGHFMVIGSLLNGATVRIKNPTTGDSRGGGIAPAGRTNFRLDPPAGPSESFDVEQQLCETTSPTTTVTTQPCSQLPPPILIAPAPGDLVVYLNNVVPGARVFILSGTDEIGDGGGSEIQLIRPVVAGETLIAIQALGTCISAKASQVQVGTGLDDPGASGTCQFESFEYGADGSLTTDVSSFFNSPAWCISHPMSAAPLHGIARVPRGSGRYPLAMIVHGNHAAQEASEPGYVYLLEQLASHCIIAVSIDENFLNLCVDPRDQVSGEMDARAVVLLRHLGLWRGWDRDPNHDLFTHVDHDRVMIMGHSRGGEAVTVAAKLNRWLHDPSDPNFDFDFGIRSLYAIAPVVDQILFDASAPLAGLPINQPLVVDEADYFVVHGSHDGDVAKFDGHKTYDRAYPVTADAEHFKGLLFVHGANHAQFNTVWVSSPDHATAIADGDVLAINKTYATAFALATLRGWVPYRALFKGSVTFPSLPVGTRVAQYQDPERAFLNHYEEDDDVGTGSRAGVSNVSVNTLDPYEDILFNTGAINYWLWQDTDGLGVGWVGGTDRQLVVRLPSEVGTLIASYPYLGFRVGQVHDPGGSRNPGGVDKDLSVRLRFSGGTTSSAVRVSSFARLPYPVSVTAWPGDVTKTVMSSVRIPWSSFTTSGEDLPWSQLEEIRFAFDQHSAGKLVIDEIQLTQ